MEFKYRAVDDRLPTYYFASSLFGTLPDQALRAGYPNIPDPILRPTYVHEAMQREIEKQRIRQEIIAAEQRRFVLEAEVRRELMMEREIAWRKAEAEGRPLFEENLTMHLERTLPFTTQYGDGFLVDERMALARSSVFDLRPLQQLPEPTAVVHEINSASMVNKDKLIMLAKPDQNLAGTKRKAVTPPVAGAGDFPFAGLGKKPKEELSCALCQVSATSEKGLNDHLQGKKHKAKEATLIKRNVGATLGAQKTGKKSSTSSMPKGTEKPSKLKETGEKAQVELLHQIKIDHPVKEAVKTKKKNTNAKASKRNNVAAKEQIEETGELRKKKFKFWCGICQIGAHSGKVMGDHKTGKKHMTRLLELSGNTVAAPIRTTVASSEPSQKATNAYLVTEETNEKTLKDVSAGSNGSGTSSLES
ncbi:hypothetical protein HS088_TW04G01471 [Tripterygium wilfordii]|uniref:U1-type domain-containing protein n=1 Tax=Tripterygium wilfordii TaxID=458696 RepID=A0A7J7DSZ0_TRIWF|nr:uncharacterized protein LOC119996422 [Tripterygium wilfordii]KAF5749502.1 hypothetical protein HS088_TW04G01471 [Tripterygium wilfordii]